MSIGVFRSGSKIDEGLLSKGKNKLLNHGQFELIDDGFPANETVYFAGNESQRTASFLNVLNNRNVEFLWAQRGGYGTIDVLKNLPLDVNTWHDKKVIGFSDLTAMHAWFSNKGIASYHGQMIATNQWVNAEGGPLKSMLNLFSNDELLPIPIHKSEDTFGRLVGGNLMVLASLMGTPWQLKLNPGDILMLEDINEPYYAMVRALKQLSYTPNFNACSLCWGELKNCGNEFGSEDELVYNLCSSYENKYYTGLQVGHGDINYCVRLGSKVSIEGGLLYCAEG